MKNNINFFIYFLLIFFFFAGKTLSEQFNFESKKIEILDNGNLLKAADGVKVTSNNNIEIIADKATYDKTSLILKINGNVKILDKNNNIEMFGEEFVFEKSMEKIFSKEKSTTIIENKYFLDTQELFYSINDEQISSGKLSILKDKLGNTIETDNFLYRLTNKIFKSENFIFLDNLGNKYYLKNAMANLETLEIIGKDLDLRFNKNQFGNTENDPRLKGNSVTFKGNTTKVNKGVFTTCKKTENCPPWVLSAEEVKHDKQKKIINYKNAWLKVYDKPVFYFPKFFHPDPTVKRQSGFLVPTYSDSSSFGSALNIPYFHVISDSKDLTLKPRIYAFNTMLLNAEYRAVTQNSNHIIDSSIKNKGFNLIKEENSKTHFFSNSKFDLENSIFKNSSIEMNLEQVSNDTYLKAYKLDSPLIKDTSTLNSYIDFTGSNDDLSFETSIEVYEDLTKEKDSDAHQYIFPNFQLNKILYSEKNINGLLEFNSSGNQKKYDTNITETSLINNINYKSFPLYSNKGLLSDYALLLKNVNTDSKNSTKYKNSKDTEILSVGMFTTSYPLKKSGDFYDKFFTPKISFRYSPSSTKNITDTDRRIDVKNVFSFNRLQSNDMVEGGGSVTLGTEYKIVSQNGLDVFDFNLASVFRDKINEDLPLKSTIGEKSSNIFGNIGLNPNKNFNFDYDFSLTNDFGRSNYDQIRTEFKINNLVNSFEYLEERGLQGDNGYWTNKTKLELDDKNSISFSKRRNTKTELNEFYNLIYQYKNDCLTAAIEYNKDYYNDGDLQPNEQLFFSLTIVPFTKFNSPNVKDK